MKDDSSGTVDLGALFADHQAEMAAKLNKLRRNLDHGSTKGTGTENAWLAMLGHYLPKRYQCTRAAVVDCNGGRSDAIDVLIFDRQYSPFILNDPESEIQLIPAESVYAVLEVKQILNKAHVEYAGGKVASVRELERTSAPVQTISGVKQRDLPPVLGGILCTASEWNPPFGDPFEKAIRGLEPQEHLDVGCALEAGAFEATRDEKEAQIAAWEGTNSLVRFLLVLLRRLQDLGTVPPIDFAKYERQIT